MDNSRSLPQVLEKLQPTEGGVPSSTYLKGEQSKQETQFPPDGPQNPAVINGPNYSLSMMPPMVGGQLVQLEGQEVQAHDNRVPNFAVSFLILFLSFAFIFFPKYINLDSYCSFIPKQLLYHNNFSN